MVLQCQIIFLMFLKELNWTKNGMKNIHLKENVER